MTTTRRAVLYLRVSTGEQTTENQRLALTAEAARRGWTIASEYEDAGISGAKGRDKRPALDKLLKDATRGKFDVVMAWALDRIGRSLADLIDTLKELDAAHVDLFLQQQAIDTTGPSGKLVFHIFGAFAEFEREILRARINAGLARARKAGKKIGRPKLSRDLDSAVRASLSQGVGILATAAAVGVGSGTVQRIKREMLAPAPLRSAPQG